MAFYTGISFLGIDFENFMLLQFPTISVLLHVTYT